LTTKKRVTHAAVRFASNENFIRLAFCAKESKRCQQKIKLLQKSWHVNSLLLFLM